jgi:hypothetical protein
MVHLSCKMYVWYVNLYVHVCLTVVYVFLLPTRGAATAMYVSNAEYTNLIDLTPGDVDITHWLCLVIRVFCHQIKYVLIKSSFKF